MSERNDMISIITDKLSIYLNKAINENLTKSAIRFYQKKNSIDSFISYLKILGLNDLERSKEIYNLINDNINLIERKLQNENSKPVINKRSENNEPKKTKKAKLTHMSFNDEGDEIISESNSSNVSFKKTDIPIVNNKVSLSFDDDDDDLLSSSDIHDKPKPSYSFKKIKKEDAIRIKNESEGEVLSIKQEDTKGANIKQETNPNLNIERWDQSSNKPLSLSDLVKLEQKSLPLKKEEEIINDNFDIDNEMNIENDREWYLADEYSNTVGESLENIDDEVEKHTRKLNRNPQINRNISGGTFNILTGEYIDYDHDLSRNFNDLSRIPLNSHYYVPPFLEEFKDDLILQIGGSSTLTKIGPTINPVKDPNSELAMSSKQGSFIVNEKRSKNERAKQAKERSSLSGTALGNVLGIDDQSQEDKKESNFNDDSKSENDFLSIQEQRRSLPAFVVRDRLIRTISENQVTIVIGETGSGKTTQLTQFLYEEGFGKSLTNDGIKKMIGCTQPRRVAAMSVAKRVSEEMNCKLGEEVGFAIRFEDKTNPNKTIIKYMTDGVLLREILVNPNLENYSCIIMDEAHERSLNTDVLLGLFKELLIRRKDLKLIVTSATMNADRFSKFFGDAPQFTIPGRTFPVEILFSKNRCTDYVETAVKQILTIHLQNSNNGNDGDILAFMTGQEDIEITCELLKDKLNLLDQPPTLDIFPIYSTMPSDLQKRIFSKKNPQRRKVVVATNIAETSLTVDGIKYVIDTGLVKLKVYNPKLGMDTLQVVPISLANAQQRSGRAGRTGPGVGYRLYTERASESDQMYLQPIPEIQRTNLSNVMLLLKSLKVDDISRFPLLDAPPRDLLNCSLYDLWSIGALDNLGDLTELGTLMSRFPMEPTLSKLILLSCRSEFHCSKEIITIVSMLSVPSVYYRPKERSREADLSREKFLISESDHLTLLNIFNQWELIFKKFNKNFSKLNSWCNKNFLQLKSLLRANDIKNQLLLIMQKNKLPILTSKSDDDIRKCLCASFYQQSAKLVKVHVNGSSEFINLRHNYLKMYLHPTSALNDSNLLSSYVIYHELVLTKKEYMNYVTSVDPLWLLEFGYIFYDVPNAYKYKLKDSDISFIDKHELENIIENDKIKYQQRISTRRKNTSNKNNSQNINISSKSKFKKRRAF